MPKRHFQITPKFVMCVVGFMLLGMLTFFAGFLDFNRLGRLTRYDISHYLLYIFWGIVAFILLQIIVGLCCKRARKWGLLASSIGILYALPALMIIVETHSPKPVIVLSVGTAIATLIEMGIVFFIRKYRRITLLLAKIALILSIGGLAYILGYEGIKEGSLRLLAVLRKIGDPSFIVLGVLNLGFIVLGLFRKSLRKWKILAILTFLALAFASTLVADYVIQVIATPLRIM